MTQSPATANMLGIVHFGPKHALHQTRIQSQRRSDSPDDTEITSIIALDKAAEGISKAEHVCSTHTYCIVSLLPAPCSEVVLCDKLFQTHS
jgi:hypothetical protein